MTASPTEYPVRYYDQDGRPRDGVAREVNGTLIWTAEAMPQRFKSRLLQETYEDMRRRGADPHSDLYLPDGSRHTGALARIRYWQGRDGVRPVGCDPQTPAHACWRAGVDDRAALKKTIQS